MVKTKQKILWPNVDLTEYFCELKENMHCASGQIILLTTIRSSWLMVPIRAPSTGIDLIAILLDLYWLLRQDILNIEVPFLLWVSRFMYFDTSC